MSVENRPEPRLEVGARVAQIDTGTLGEITGTAEEGRYLLVRWDGWHMPVAEPRSNLRPAPHGTKLR